MKIIASIFVLVLICSCEPKPDKNNNFSHVIYESKTDITITLDKNRFQIDYPKFRKLGTREMNFLRKVIISNHTNKMFLIGSNIPEYKIATSYSIEQYSTKKNEWSRNFFNPIPDTFFFELLPYSSDTFKIFDPLTDSDSTLFSIEIYEKGKLTSEPKIFYVHKGML